MGFSNQLIKEKEVIEKILDLLEKWLCKCGMHDWHGEVIDGMIFEKCAVCGKVQPFGECKKYEDDL